MSSRWTLKYGSAAVLIAIAIIASSFLANPSMLPGAKANPTFAIMLTDPPTAPAGTTQLNLTYSGISLHVIYTDEKAEWVPVTAHGTVNLFSLINMSQTLASTTIPVGSTVDKMQFTIDDVKTEVNGATYNVTTLSSTLTVQVADGKVNQTLSGVLLDFNPTLVEIQSTNANGANANYYVLVPSATAIIVNGIDEEELKVGTLVKIGEDKKVKLLDVEEEFKKDVTIVSASLTVNGDSTELSVTLKNNGDYAFRIFGLTLHGEFTTTKTLLADKSDDDDDFEQTVQAMHPRTIPFKISDSSLVPLFGSDREHDEQHEEDEELGHRFSSVILQAGQEETLTFSGVISFGHEHSQSNITPTVDSIYTLKLMGEGFETFDVTATASS